MSTELAYVPELVEAKIIIKAVQRENLLICNE